MKAYRNNIYPGQSIKMTPLNLQDVTQYVEQNIGEFHNRQLEVLAKIDLKKILKKTKTLIYLRLKMSIRPRQKLLTAF